MQRRSGRRRRAAHREPGRIKGATHAVIAVAIIAIVIGTPSAASPPQDEGDPPGRRRPPAHLHPTHRNISAAVVPSRCGLTSRRRAWGSSRPRCTPRPCSAHPRWRRAGDPSSRPDVSVGATRDAGASAGAGARVRPQTPGIVYVSNPASGSARCSPVPRSGCLLSAKPVDGAGLADTAAYSLKKYLRPSGDLIQLANRLKVLP
jgi:hypothetical protein